MADPFPPIKLENEKGKPDYNPAIRVFGRRFPVDQSLPELLLELLLVASSPKRISTDTLLGGEFLPSMRELRDWPELKTLRYAPKARLNLKLFAFLGSSRLDTRDHWHVEHYKELIRLLSLPERMTIAEQQSPIEILKTLENLFLGLQSVGGQRTWCAQSFLPIAEEFLAGESIWQETKARRQPAISWDDSLKYFSHNQQIFLARGGELLYLQLCNLLRRDEAEILSWLKRRDLLIFGVEELRLENLHKELLIAIETVLSACPTTVRKMAVFLDGAADHTTSRYTDTDNEDNTRYVTCGWCPAESWKEGLFFAIELIRICKAVIDPIERIELLEIACAMQMLRSLCAQAARYTVGENDSVNEFAGPLGYVWAISDPAGKHNAVKQISRRNVNSVQRMIHDAIRHPDIQNDYSDAEKMAAYREADRRYGHKLFLTVAKRLGLIVPRQGSGARFVLNDRVLRYLVLSVIRPGERVTYDSFKQLIYTHHGIAVDEAMIGRSCRWSGTTQLTTLGGDVDRWLLEMLDASGMLIRLSDSCSLVMNPFGLGVPRS